MRNDPCLVPRNFCLDSAHDSVPTYKLLEDYGVNTFVDFNGMSKKYDKYPASLVGPFRPSWSLSRVYALLQNIWAQKSFFSARMADSSALLTSQPRARFFITSSAPLVFAGALRDHRADAAFRQRDVEYIGLYSSSFAGSGRISWVFEMITATTVFKVTTSALRLSPYVKAH